LPLLVGFPLWAFICSLLHGDEINTKAVGTAGGFALVGMSPMPVGKQVFLLGIGAISTVMRCMTPAVTTVKKPPLAVKKVRLAPVEKQLLVEAPPRPSPRGGSSFLLCFRRLGGTPSLWGGLGRGSLPWQLCKSCDFIAQGLRRAAPLPWVSASTIFATL